MDEYCIRKYSRFKRFHNVLLVKSSDCLSIAMEKRLGLAVNGQYDKKLQF